MALLASSLALLAVQGSCKSSPPAAHEQLTGAAAPLSSWSLVYLNGSSAPEGAVCLDGSPPAVYIKPGVGDDASKWILFFEGGGWCESAQDCYARSFTALGSSSSYAATTAHWSTRDVLLPDCVTNPYFCRFSSAYAPYCDGASRAGNADLPVVYKDTNLYYRGWRVLQATLAALLIADPGAGAAGGPVAMPSLAKARSLLISGSSAGGLTTFLHADFIAETVHTANPSIAVLAVPEVGFFIDGASIWGGAHIQSAAFERVSEFANVTGGLPDQVNAGCVAASTPSTRWTCFMAQYTYPHIRTPTFLLQSRWDEWQTQHVLAPDPDVTVTVSPYKPFAACILDPSTGCNATQYAQWFGYGKTQFPEALAAARAAMPAKFAAANGGFITSCPIHTTAISGLSHRIKIDNVSMYDALVAWVEQSEGAGADYWTQDVDWPGDTSCPKPSAALFE